MINDIFFQFELKFLKLSVYKTNQCFSKCITLFSDVINVILMMNLPERESEFISFPQKQAFSTLDVSKNCSFNQLCDLRVKLKKVSTYLQKSLLKSI